MEASKTLLRSIYNNADHLGKLTSMNEIISLMSF